MTPSFWDEKFSGNDYLYGMIPNLYYKEILDGLNPGTLLIPGEGEGRNAVYAAKNGWNVYAFDSSERGREKALELARRNNVEIDYELSNYQSFHSEKTFDVIALIFSHLPSADRQAVHRKYVQLLKPGGTLILQTFSKEQLGLNTGGPKDLNLLFSVEELEEDFNQLTELSVERNFIELDEGPLHRGKAHVISLKGIK